MTGLLVACIVLLSVIAIAVIAGLALVLRRLGDTARELELTLRAVREEVVPLTADVKKTLATTDTAVSSAQESIDRIGRITAVVEHLLEGRMVTDAAGKVVNGSRTTLVSLLEGVKQGLKVLRNVRSESEEGSNNGQ